MLRHLFVVLILLGSDWGLVTLISQSSPSVQSDLDAFIDKVLAKRDDNWKRLQQYILEERERIEIRGPGRLPVWGDDREYRWYLRDGYFVRSSRRFNGFAIGEDERRKYEEAFLRRQRERETREAERSNEKVVPPVDPAGKASPNVEALILQARDPQFVSSAYFLRFKFEQGRYALVGREQFEGLDVLRIEYYPTRLFKDDKNSNNREPEPQRPKREDQVGAEIDRLMNKLSLVTLWVEPRQYQIVKYTFDNVGLDFLPMSWLVRINEMRANMVMGQAFPKVWLPQRVEMNASMTLGLGQFDVSYNLTYYDYRQADVTSKVR